MRRAVTTVLTAVMVAAVSASVWAAPNAAAIIRKAAEPMKKARTYQAKWRMVMSMGDMGAMSMDMDVKTTSDGKAYVSTVPVGTPTGMMAMGAGMAASTTVSDGKVVYMYMKGMNAYQKMPASRNPNGAIRGILGALDQKGVTFAYLGTEMVRGKKCHVIRINTPKEQQARMQGAKQDVRAYVDAATNQLRQIKTVTTMPPMGPPPGSGNAPSGQKQKPVVMTTTMVLLSEKLNAPIPASTFKFVPPKGATEMKAGMQPGMPGPGGPPPGRPVGPPPGMPGGPRPGPR